METEKKSGIIELPKLVSPESVEASSELGSILENHRRSMQMLGRQQPTFVPVDVKLLHPDAQMPEYAHDTDSGFDIFSTMNHDIAIHEVCVIPTGIAIQVPEAYDCQFYDKSGLAAKGIHVLGGVIDTAYNGELKVILANFGYQVYLVESGDKIAQVRVMPRYKAVFRKVDELVARERGSDGFGSTGLKAKGMMQ